MKKIAVVLLVILVFVGTVSCGATMEEEDVVRAAKNSYLSGYADKSIGNAINLYFKDKCRVEWSASGGDDGVYTVEVCIRAQNGDSFAFGPNKLMNIVDLYYSFSYHAEQNKITKYEIYGVVDENGKYLFFEAKTDSEKSLFLDPLYGKLSAETQEHIKKLEAEIEALENLKSSVSQAKTNNEAWLLAGNSSVFPLNYSYLWENRVEKQEILDLIASLIKENQDTIASLKDTSL